MNTEEINVAPENNKEENGKKGKAAKVAGKAAQMAGSAAVGAGAAVAAEAMMNNNEEHHEDGFVAQAQPAHTEAPQAPVEEEVIEVVEEFDPNDIMIDDLEPLTLDEDVVEILPGENGDLALADDLEPITGEAIIIDPDQNIASVNIDEITVDPILIDPDPGYGDYEGIVMCEYGGPDGWDELEEDPLDLLADNNLYPDDSDILDDILNA